MSPVTLKGKDLEAYNKTAYSAEWLDSSEYRLSSDYYRRDHSLDTLEALRSSAGTRVFESGIGTGEFFALSLARAGKSVYGIDFAAPLLGDCKKRFLAAGFPVRLGMADARRLPFRAGSFDASYAIGVMPYMEDLDLAVGELVRVTRPGGVVIFDLMNLWHPSQLFNYWYRAFESSAVGFWCLDRLKRFKKALGLRTHFKDRPGKVNYNLISPWVMSRVVRRLGLRYRVRGYNVLLPLDMAVLGERANLCKRFPFFAQGLKDAPVLRYFGSKLVFIIEP